MMIGVQDAPFDLDDACGQDMNHPEQLEVKRMSNFYNGQPTKHVFMPISFSILLSKEVGPSNSLLFFTCSFSLY